MRNSAESSPRSLKQILLDQGVPVEKASGNLCHGCSTGFKGKGCILGGETTSAGDGPTEPADKLVSVYTATSEAEYQASLPTCTFGTQITAAIEIWRDQFKQS